MMRTARRIAVSAALDTLRLLCAAQHFLLLERLRAAIKGALSRKRFQLHVASSRNQVRSAVLAHVCCTSFRSSDDYVRGAHNRKADILNCSNVFFIYFSSSAAQHCGGDTIVDERESLRG